MNVPAQHNDMKSVHSLYPAEGAPVPAHGVPHGGMVPEAGNARPASELLDPERVNQVRRANLDGQLKSNFWFEVSRLAMWATTGFIALTVGTFFAAAGTPLAVISPFVPLIGAVVAGAVLIGSSQYSKQTFANRWFDVQDFQMQRSAALVGKSVEHAVVQGAGESPPRWSDKFQPRSDSASWSQDVESEKATTSQNQRA
jgi:hypothetical protein